MLKIILTIGGIQVLAILVSLVRSKVVAVLLGPEGVGITSVIDQVVQLAAYLSAFSLPFASVKFLSRAHSEGTEAFRRTYSGFLKALLVLSAAGALIAIGLVTLRVGLLAPELARYKSIVLLALLGIPAMTLGGFLPNVFAAAQNYRASSLLAVISNGALAAAGCAGILLAGMWGLYVGNVLAYSLVVLGVLLYLRRALGLPLLDRGVRIIRELRAGLGPIYFSVVLYVAAATLSFSMLVARSRILAVSGEVNAGLLQAVIALALSIGLVLNPTNGLFLTPLMNRNTATGEKLRTALEYQRKLTLILAVVAMPLALFPATVLTLLFSPRFVDARQYAFLFVVAQAIVQLAGVYQAVLIGLDELRSYALVTCTGHLAIGLLSWLLAPVYGVWGVAAALLVSPSIIYTGTLAVLRWRHGLRVPAGLGAMMAYTLAALALAGFIFRNGPEWDVQAILLRFGAYGVFVLSLALFLSGEEREAVSNWWSRLAARPRLVRF